MGCADLALRLMPDRRLSDDNSSRSSQAVSAHLRAWRCCSECLPCVRCHLWSWTKLTPLDEANVTRFGDAIRELSERTQVVVITHNRGTVEVADSLWGVTAGEDATSRVFGLRLDEAKRIADAARAEREAAR